MSKSTTSKADAAPRVVLSVKRDAAIALAERLGEIAADLWLAGAVDLEDENTLTDESTREIVTGT